MAAFENAYRLGFEEVEHFAARRRHAGAANQGGGEGNGIDRHRSSPSNHPVAGKPRRFIEKGVALALQM